MIGDAHDNGDAYVLRRNWLSAKTPGRQERKAEGRLGVGLWSWCFVIRLRPETTGPDRKVGV